ncbi:MAG: hypothetical protein SGJ23_17475 [Alphaproteobacteria bacterium]|nr:hypothetical protein [Alphaproteobacteria bacterium]
MAEAGWTLVSAEERARKYADTFHIPDAKARASLQYGDAARLLFDIETRQGGRVADVGVDRMWVVVLRIDDDGYWGVLDNDPGTAEGLNLNFGDVLCFSDEHICEVARPPEGYVSEKYGEAYFKGSG